RWARWRWRPSEGSGPARSRDSSGTWLALHGELLVERAQDLVDPGGRPHVEERRLLHGEEFAPIPVFGLRFRLAGPRRLLIPADQVLVINGRILDVAVQLLKVLRIEDGDQQRRPLTAVFRVQEFQHEIVVAVGVRDGIGPPRAEDPL